MISEKMLELATERGFQIATITEGWNGYPQNLTKVVVGFPDFSEVEDFAKETDGKIVLLSKRDGHQFYKNLGETDEPMDLEDYYDDNRYIFFNSGGDFDEWAESRIDEERCWGLEHLELICGRLAEIQHELNRIGAEEAVIVDIKNNYSCEVQEVIRTKLHDDDVTTYEIGVILDK